MTRDVAPYEGMEIAVSESLSESGIIVAGDVPDHFREAWGAMAPQRYANAVKSIDAALQVVSEPSSLIAEFDSLSPSIQDAIFEQLGLGLLSKHHVRPARDVDSFFATDEGRILRGIWGARRAPLRLSMARKRVGYVLDQLDDDDALKLLDWFDGLNLQDAAAVYVALAGR
jgi:hypothetical protein